jgi:4-amino-4-deoxy-L-arabinose transferase-like glycosyltransferase
MRLDPTAGSENVGSPRQNHRGIAAVVLLSLCLNAYPIWWGLPSRTGWAPDELTPSEVIEGMSAGFSNGWHTRYPPLHYYVLATLYAPVAGLHSLGVLQIDSRSVYTSLFLIGRITSLIMATLTVLVVYLCGRELYGARPALAASLLVALLRPFVFYGKLANLDVPYVFWFACSLLFYIRVMKRHALRDYLLLSATAVLAICTKDQAYGFYVLVPFAIAVAQRSRVAAAGVRRPLLSTLIDKRVGLSLLLACALFAALFNLPFNLSGFLAHVKLITGPASQCCQESANTLAGHLELAGRSVSSMRASFGWPAWILCLAGLVSSLANPRRDRLLLALLVPAISYYCFYVAVILYVYDRFLIPIGIILALFGGPILDALWNARRPFRPVGALLAAVMMLYTFLYASAVDRAMAGDARYAAEEWFEQHVAPEASVLLVGYTKYLPRIHTPGTVDTTTPSLGDLARSTPDYVVTIDTWRPKGFLTNPTARDFFARLEDGTAGYSRAYTYKADIGWPELDIALGDTNLAKINPAVTIFERAPNVTGRR